MRFLIASDIHGSATWCERLLDVVERERPDRILLLGDVLYHGPRNDLPEGYAPKQVIAMLNPLAASIVAVRGNCEAEVDQMVLDFPCMAEYNVLLDPDANHGAGMTIFLTHGHVWGPGIHNSVDAWPELPQGSALVYGHTHKKVNQLSDSHPGITVFNPGSVGIPKDGTHSYGIYENGHFEFRVWDE